MSEITVPVLIGGGGGAGLTASMLLSSYGMDSLLVRKYPGTSHLPKAHVLQQRTMEVYRELGVAEPIYARGTPPEHMAFTGWYAGVAGPTPEYGREIAQLECWGNGDSDPNWMKHLTTVQVLGMTPDKTPEENWEIMRQLWSDEPQAELLRVQFENAIASQAMEFYEQNVEYGYTYTSPAIVPDGTPAPQVLGAQQVLSR